MTVAGRERVDRAIRVLLEAETALLGALSAPERRRLAELLRSFALGFDA